MGILTADALAANLIANTSQVTDIRSGEIEQDGTRKMKISPPSGGMKIALEKLTTGTVKGAIRSFQTAIPLTKLCGVDQLIREYLLYVLGDRINLPLTQNFQQNTQEIWQSRGHQLAAVQAKQFSVLSCIFQALQAAAPMP